jgi:hypothetical protein
MSQRHNPDDPSVIIVIVPTCDTQKCKDGASALIEHLRQDQVKHDKENGCQVCGKYAGLQQCKRCKSVRYCSAQRQKEDWPSHKRTCKIKGKDKDMGIREVLEVTVEAERVQRKMKRMADDESLQERLEMQADLEDLERKLAEFKSR